MTDKYRFNSIDILVSEDNYTNIYIDGTRITGITGFELECKTADELGSKPRIRLNLTIKR